LSKILSKRMMSKKIFFAKLWLYNCEKSIFIVIYGKYLCRNPTLGEMGG
jgi:hypothetical protein